MSSIDPLPAFVGRRTQLDHLLNEAAAVGSGGARTSLVVGDAGIGKTRLISEYLAKTPLARTVVGGCLEMGTEGIAFAPFAAILRQLVRDTGEPVAGGELARLVPGLGPVPEATEESRARLFEAVLTFLEESARPGGLVVVVEDLHWADASTRDLLVFLLRNLDAVPVHLVVSVRSDDLHRTHPLRRLLPEIERLPGVGRLDLAALSREEVAEQVTSLGHRADPDLLHERSGGNPLFVESFLADPAPLESALPDGPRELLLRAVEPLSEDTRAVLGLASVAGDRVDHALLARVADGSGIGEEDLDAALRPAIDARVLHTTGTGYAFRHALLAEAVQAELLPGERVRAHRRYADALEEPLAGRVNGANGEVAAQLARHAYAAHDHPRALTAAWAAAEHAAATAAHPEHLDLLERVLELWDLVPDAAERVGLAHGELLRRACLAAQIAGSLRRAHSHATAGLRGTDPATDPELTAGLLLARARVRKDQGRTDALDDLRAAAELIPGEHPLRPTLDAATATVLMLIGRDEEAERLTRKVIEAARRIGDRVTEMDALMTLASLIGDTGDPATHGPVGGVASGRAGGAAVGELLREGIRIARETGQIQVEVRGWRHLAAHLAHELLLEESYRAAERGLERCAELGVLRTQGVGCAVMMACQLNNMGRTNEAWEMLERFPRGQAREEARLQSQLSLMYTFRGEWEKAREALDAFARLLPRDVSSPMEYLNLYYSRMYLHMHRGEPVAAALVVEEAQAHTGILDPGRFSYSGLAVIGELVTQLRREDGPEAARLTASLTEQLTANLEHDRGVVSPQGRLGRELLLGYLATDPERALAHMEAAIPVAEAARHQGMHGQALVGAVRAAHATGRVERARELLDRFTRTVGEQDDVFVNRRDLAELRALLGPAGSDRNAEVLAAGLTRREAEVLAEVAKGASNREVGETLFISAKTVSVHLSNLMAKLGADNRTAAVARSRELGLL